MTILRLVARLERSADLILQDLRDAVRVLTRRPAFAAGAALTLALGVGASTAIFSIVDGVLFQPLPFRDAGRLAVLQYEYTDDGRRNEYISIPDFFDWQRAETFDGLAAADWPLSRALTGVGVPEKLTAARITANFFQVLGVEPAVGRFFHRDETSAGQHTVAILSHRLWQQRFGGDAAVIGRHILVDGQPHVVVGVMPAGLDLPTPADLWLPLSESPVEAGRRTNLLQVFGRLAPGTSFDAARVEMATMARQLAASYPETNERHGVAVIPLWEAWLGDERAPLVLLLGAVGLLVVLAVANVSNLLLVRLVSREGELVLRSVLGASRVRLLRQLAIESLTLVGAGGLLGVWLAYAGLGILVSLLPADLPRVQSIGMDLRTLSFAGATVMLVSLTLALLSARRAKHLGLREASAEGRDPGQGWQRSRLRGLLVGAQMAVATLLLLAAALLGRSLLALHHVDPGFRTEGIVSFRVSLPDDVYPDSSDAIRFFDRLLPELRRLPGVGSAGLTSAMPLSGSNRTTSVQAQAGDRREVVAGFHAVSSNYFDTLGIPLLAGRTFRETDGPQTPEVAVVDEALARELWPGRSPIGERISRSGPAGPWIEVVGLVAGVRHRTLRQTPVPTFYSPYALRGWDTMFVVVQTNGESSPLIDAARNRMATLAPDLPVDAVSTLEGSISTTTAATRLQAVLLGVFAVVSVVIAALGIYAIVAHGVERRVPEIGIRVALGATPIDVVRLVIREGWPQVATGVGAGVAVALAMRETLASVLFGVVPTDPLTFGLVAIALLAVAFGAMYVPARRAARLDAAHALRAR
jgi:putative ABC transport system permease protein